MLLVHGTAGLSGDWQLAIPHLQSHFTVVTMDRRGRGMSGDGSEYSMDREADDILGVLDAVDADVLVGHSFGALCSILAATRTDRLRRLVLYEPPIGVTHDGIAGLEEVVGARDYERALAGFLRIAGATREQLEQLRRSEAWPVLLGTVPTIPRELRAAASWQHPGGPISVPTLFLVGGDTTSDVYLGTLDELQAAFRCARRELIPGELHLAQVFAPEALARVVTDFCSS